MTDLELQDYLRDNGYPERVVAQGRVGLLQKWRAFVEQVERGYLLGLEDYRHGLDVRGILTLAGVEDEMLRALDQRLQHLLIATEIRLWESLPANPFWDFGYPCNAGKALLQNLRDEGLLQSP
jgi:hypothetical protein